MRTSLFTTLAALLCALTAGADVAPMKDFDVTQVNGKWYLVGFSTNSQWFVDHRDGMKMGVTMMVPTEEGDLNLSYATLNADGTCWRTSHLANKTETPGRFTFHSQAWNNDNDMRFVDVQYAEYALDYNIKTKAGVSEVLVKLYSRTTEVSAVVQQKFRQLALDGGVLPDNTVILPKNGECPDV
ncbi:hypothetical protein NHX12_020993 [Muraenolepis orangiensis]|uniref:Lipocalin/cytosolic fatty-acid binding domain-containing protein n=1 Tax=Muraenolepis orangiensis TaxID=630683 RepID=A0A9Q0IRW6_9TELE|nr:hypothetical protein NHX12_020993 [Muraenolepis orangiensis]